VKYANSISSPKNNHTALKNFLFTRFNLPQKNISQSSLVNMRNQQGSMIENTQALIQSNLVRSFNSNHYSISAEASNNTRPITTPQDMRELLLQTPCTLKLQLLRATREEYPKRIINRRIRNQRKVKGTYDLYDMNREMELYIQRMKLQQKIFKREEPRMVKLCTRAHAEDINSKKPFDTTESITKQKNLILIQNEQLKKRKASLNNIHKSLKSPERRTLTGNSKSVLKREKNLVESLDKHNSSLDGDNKSLTIQKKEQTKVHKCKRRKKYSRTAKKQKTYKAESVVMPKPRPVITAPDLYTVRGSVRYRLLYFPVIIHSWLGGVLKGGWITGEKLPITSCSTSNGCHSRRE